MEKDPAALTVLEEHVIIDPDGFIQLSANLTHTLGVQPGMVVSFKATEGGFNVSGSSKPNHVHYEARSPRKTPHSPRQRRGDNQAKLFD